MGNKISFDVDEFFVKFTYKTSKSQDHKIFTESKLVKWSFIEMETFNFVCGKFYLTELRDGVIENS